MIKWSLYVHFTVEAVDAETGARAGRFETPHGPVLTPAFMPVGTQATVKSLDPTELHALGARIVLANTYHLSLRPGAETVARLGGLHRFMAWDGPILTNSGGFQVFSLAHLRRLDEDGVTFRSHIDGSERRLTPEVAIRAPGAARRGRDHGLRRVPRGPRHLRAHPRAPSSAPTAGPSAAGGPTPAPTRPCSASSRGASSTTCACEGARAIGALDFPGYAIGGVSVGESKADCWRVAALVAPLLPAGRPRYLMGVGSPEDLAQGVGAGIDLFDCVLPTRLARNGTVLTDAGRESLVRSRWRETEGPFDPTCDCSTCARFSAAYLHHLFRAEELLAHRLASVHNLRYMARLSARMRQAILEQRFGAWRAELPGRLPRGGRGPAPGAALEAPRRLGGAPRRAGRARPGGRTAAAGRGPGRGVEPARWAGPGRPAVTPRWPETLAPSGGPGGPGRPGRRPPGAPRGTPSAWPRRCGCTSPAGACGAGPPG